MLHGLPDAEITVRTDPAQALADALAVATDQENFFRDINHADHDPLKGQVAVRQGELATRAKNWPRQAKPPDVGDRFKQLDAAAALVFRSGCPQEASEGGRPVVAAFHHRASSHS